MVLLRIVLSFLFCATPLIECAAPVDAPAHVEAPAPAKAKEPTVAPAPAQADSDAAPAARKPRVIVRRKKFFDQYPDEMVNGDHYPEREPLASDVFGEVAGEVFEKGYDLAARGATLAHDKLVAAHILRSPEERKKRNAEFSARMRIADKWQVERKHIEDDFYAQALRESKGPCPRDIFGGVILSAEKKKALDAALATHDDRVLELLKAMAKRPPSLFRKKSVNDAYALLAPEAAEAEREKMRKKRAELEQTLRTKATQAHRTARKWFGFGPLVLTDEAEAAIQKELEKHDESAERYLERVFFKEEIPAGSSTPPPALDTTATKAPAAPKAQEPTTPAAFPVQGAPAPATSPEASRRRDDEQQSPGKKGSSKKKKATTPVAQGQQAPSLKTDASHWKRYVTIGSGAVAIPAVVYLALLQIEWKNYQEDLRTGFNEEPIPFGVYLKKRFLSFNAKSLNDWLCKVVLPVACATGGWYLTNGTSVPVVSTTAPAA